MFVGIKSNITRAGLPVVIISTFSIRDVCSLNTMIATSLCASHVNLFLMHFHTTTHTVAAEVSSQQFTGSSRPAPSINQLTSAFCLCNQCSSGQVLATHSLHYTHKAPWTEEYTEIDDRRPPHWLDSTRVLPALKMNVCLFIQACDVL